jgi:hypothetical protein
MGKQRAAKLQRRGARAMTKELRRRGVFAEMEEVHQALQSGRFRLAFRALIDEVRGTDREPRNEEGIRARAIDVLDGIGVSSKRIVITVIWRPDVNRTLTFSCEKVKPEVVADCEKAIRARNECLAEAA